MLTNELYQQLQQALKAGLPAAIVSSYAAKGGISKHLVAAAADDAHAWAEVVAFESDPQTTIDGPVASQLAADGTQTLVERYRSKPRFIILGAGHIAAALAPLAVAAEFEVIVYDDRMAFANRQRFPEVDEVICDGFDQVFTRIPLRASDYVVVVTRGHKHDTECLRGILAGVEPAYTGMIGSQRRVAIVMDQLLSEGSDSKRIEAIHSPIGLKIGAVTPAEIAISIIAEIIAVKRIERGEARYSSCDPGIAEELATRGDAFDATITIVSTEGSVPIETGAKLAMTYAGQLAGTIGGGCSEGEALQAARNLLNSSANSEVRWCLHTVDMTDSAEEDGMVCGGVMQVLIEIL
jgi:xanthine dehydrogenase accessory factor